jgi:7-carboxy-7-deazaguanine synthase
MLQIREIFYSLQGEGPYAGLPAVFIRLSGCNLSCWFCDTTWDTLTDERMSAIAVAKAARAKHPDVALAVITGGEPLLQPLEELISQLQGENFDVIQIETNGTLWQPCLEDDDVIAVVVSPKTRNIHPEFMTRPNTYWKYVAAGPLSQKDGLPETDTQIVDGEARGGAPARPPEDAPIYIQPCDGEARSLRNAVASSLRHGHRLSIQLHKLAGIR